MVASLVESEGFAIVPRLAPVDLIEGLRALCPEVPGAGIRGLLERIPAFAELSHLESVRSLAESILGKPAFVTRAILFDKSPAANWNLGFHQDVVIAVHDRADLPGFGPWSIKAGVHHVRPPAAVLERMVTVRINLDDCGPDNGPLLVIPRTHSSGFLDDADLERRIAAGPVVECTGAAGDAVVMRPLVLHGSKKSIRPAHRRVAHFEFACDPLPPPLRWRDDA